MMAASEAQKKATIKYQKENKINKTVSLYKKGDADIIKHIATKKSFGGYIKELIREDIKKESSKKN